MAATRSAAQAQAHGFLDYVDASPTPYHAVHEAAQRLVAAGFVEIKERDSWSSTLQPGGKYYLTRNGSSIVAFAVGKRWRAGNPIAIVSTHTDSCTLRIKPVSKKSAVGFLQVGVETYGGSLWHTWFDRDLSIAGRVMVREKDTFVQRLVKVEKPLLRIPTLAIHLNREASFSPNKETELFPIAGLVAAELNRTGGTSTKDASEGTSEKTAEGTEPFRPLAALTDRHHPYLVEIIAEHAGVAAEDVVDFEISLFDTQKACIGGLNDELIFSGRLDNLVSTYCGVRGLIDSVAEESALEQDRTIRMVACFDHEEIGSMSAQGAASNLLPAVIRRLSVILGASDASSEGSYEAVRSPSEPELATAYEQTVATSFMLSADMAHSVHPNYAAKHESDHRPEMNKGPVIKINASQRYATNSPGVVLVQEVARRARRRNAETEATAAETEAEKSPAAGVPLQLFVVRNDSSCGSTIGPMLSAFLGMRTLDLGNPQLSMHSIRETGGVDDVEHAVRLFDSFFTHFGDLEGRILVD